MKGGRLLEVEVKARVDDLDAIEGKLGPMGFELVGEEEHYDVYFGHPSRDFGETDEALRLRTITKGGKERMVLTYKGPKVDPGTKTREEAEVEVVADPTRLLEGVGFEQVITIGKVRRKYKKGDLEVCLDRVPGLGSFVEIECMSRELDEARDRVMALAKELGLEELERLSYLELFMQEKTKN